MVQCAALNCTNNTSSGQKISFFSFPKDKNTKAAWVVRVKRDGFTPSAHTRLCEKHFEPECYTNDPPLMKSIGFEVKCLRLKPDAIPTNFDYSKPFPYQKRPWHPPDLTLSAHTYARSTPSPVGVAVPCKTPESDAGRFRTPSRKRSMVIHKRRRLEVILC